MKEELQTKLNNLNAKSSANEVKRYNDPVDNYKSYLQQKDTYDSTAFRSSVNTQNSYQSKYNAEPR